MEFIEAMNQRVKKLSFFDIQLVKAGNWFFALIIVKLIPEIMNVNIGLSGRKRYQQCYDWHREQVCHIKDRR